MLSQSTPRRTELTGFALAALAAILFSAKAILAKFLYRHQIDPITLMTLRMGMALPVFAAVALVESRRARKRGDRLNGREWRQIGFLGFVGYYVSSYLDFWGLQHIAAALERLILFLTPTLVIALGVLFYGKSVPGRQRWALAISYAGTVLVFIEHLRFDGGSVVFGSALVFGAALAYASYLVLSGELVARVGTLRLVSYVMLVSTVCCLVHYLLVHPPRDLLQPLPVLQLSLVNALACTVAPVFLTMFAIARIGAARITVVQLIGTAVVLVGIGVLTAPKAAISK